MNTISRINQALDKIQPLLWHLICIMISLIFFSVILINRSPNALRPLSISLRTGFGLVIPLTTLIVYLVFRIPGRVGQLLTMSTVLSLFALPLAGLWASGQSQTTVMNGLIPMTDAGSYYIDALGLADGQRLTIVSSRRPLFSGLLAVLLSLSDYNLMISLAVLTLLVGLACYFTAREIQQAGGPEAAVFILMIVFLFYRIHSGAAMTENLGVTLGVLGVGMLWRGAAEQRLPFILLGLLTTTLAFNARAGAFFMIPLLILWAGWLLQKGRWDAMRVMALGALTVLLGFVLNLGLTRLVAVSDVVPFGNFSYTLYGLAAGGKSWSFVFQMHPELSLLTEPSTRVYQLAFELIRDNPLQIIRGALFNWRMLFPDSWYNIYSYVGGENWHVNVAARWILYLLGLLGVVAWFRDRNDPIKSLVMISMVGIMISVPFLPPTDAYRMRPYAANIIILAALPALGMKFLIDQTGAGIFRQDVDRRSLSPLHMLIFWAGLMVLMLAGPVIVKLSAHPVSFTQKACQVDLDFIVTRFDAGTYINIRKQGDPFLDWMPNFHIGQFRQSSHSMVDENFTSWANTLEPVKTVFLARDYHRQSGVLVVIPAESLPLTDSLLQICGRYQDGHGGTIFNAEEILVLSQ